MNNKRFLSQMMMLLGLISVIASCSQPSPLQTSTTPTVHSSTPTVLATPQPTATATPTFPPLGPVPQNCPPGPTPREIFPDVGPGFGSLPVWAVGLEPVIRIPTSYFTYTQYGWTWKILWRVSDSSPSPITLQAGPLRNGPLLWFQIGDQNPTTSPTLAPVTPDPAYLTVTNAPWTDFPSYFFIPKAGCYYLEAAWPGGHWRITFAAGL